MKNQIIHENCQAHGACLLKQFFWQYRKCTKFYPHSLTDDNNCDAFKVKSVGNAHVGNNAIVGVISEIL